MVDSQDMNLFCLKQFLIFSLLYCFHIDWARPSMAFPLLIYSSPSLCMEVLSVHLSRVQLRHQVFWKPFLILRSCVKLISSTSRDPHPYLSQLTIFCLISLIQLQPSIPQWTSCRKNYLLELFASTSLEYLFLNCVLYYFELNWDRESGSFLITYIICLLNFRLECL